MIAGARNIQVMWRVHTSARVFGEIQPSFPRRNTSGSVRMRTVAAMATVQNVTGCSSGREMEKRWSMGVRWPVSVHHSSRCNYPATPERLDSRSTPVHSSARSSGVVAPSDTPGSTLRIQPPRLTPAPRDPPGEENPANGPGGVTRGVGPQVDQESDVSLSRDPFAQPLGDDEPAIGPRDAAGNPREDRHDKREEHEIDDGD